MADLLPSAPDPSVGDGGDPRVIGVDSEDAADLLAALQSETARDILAALYDDPATPSTLADAVDTSIQNVRYHLEKLADADLVAVADTVYSEKGREMKVYAPAATPLVVFAGGDDAAPGVEAALSRLLGALGVLGLSSLLVQRFFGGGIGGADEGSGAEFQGQSAVGTTTADAQSVDYQVGDDAATTAADAGAGPNSDATEVATEATRTVAEEGDAATTVAEAARTTADAATTAHEFVQSTTTAADGAGAAMAGLPPGLVFFLGGAVVLAALGIAQYVRAR